MADETDLTDAEFSELLAASGLGAPHVLAVLAADPAAPSECPCGHDLVSGEYMCIRGVIYGPCPDPNCGGVCEGEAGYRTHPDCACALT